MHLSCLLPLTPSPSDIHALLESIVKTTCPSVPLYKQLVSALEETKVHDDDLEEIREEGQYRYIPEVHEQVIAQAQEEWALYYHRVIVPLILAEVLARIFQEVKEQ